MLHKKKLILYKKRMFHVKHSFLFTQSKKPKCHALHILIIVSIIKKLTKCMFHHDCNVNSILQ